ncbi:MAG: hypothetical protein Q8P18_21910 [Pseudomonadota bacterium]|nr:hypothetical protein [Pseudomonadota bacterium]
MPYELHGRLTTPDDEVVVWHYLGLPQLTSLLNKRSLFFCRLDALEDKFEGMLPRSMVNLRREFHAKHTGPVVEKYDALINEATDPAQAAMFNAERTVVADSRDIVLSSIPERRACTAVSCWHMNDEEAMGMWRTYGSPEFGIAIKSSVARLKEALRAVGEPVYVAKVEYHNYESAPARGALMNRFVPVFWKQAAFRSEAELRCAVFDRDMSPTGISWFNPKGVSVPVDIDGLIERIVVSPAAAPWYIETVAALVQRFGFTGPVQPSELAADPSY